MTVPINRATFKEYCLRKLGKPVIEINVDDDQVDDRVDEALRFYYDWHFDGTEKVYYKYQITAQDVTNGYIQMPDNVIGAVDIFPLSAISSGNMFNIKYQFALNDLYTLTNLSMIPYGMTMAYISFLEEMLVGKQPIRYNRNVNLLYIDTDWSLISAGQYIVVSAYQVISPDVYVKAWSEPLLMRLATALIKEQWGDNLGKFQDMPMAGGMRLNWRNIITDAREERLRVEQMIRDSSLPATDMIG